VVKICGLTRGEDIVLARDLGAWALGFVFAPSPRRLAPATARGLIDQVARDAWVVKDSTSGKGYAGMLAPLAVGVFGNVPAEQIARVVEQVGLDAVQLHGDSSPGARSVREALAGWESPLRLAGGSERAGWPADGPGPSGSAGASGPGSRGVLIIQAVPVAVEERDPAAVSRRVEQARVDADLILLDTRKSGRFGGTGAAFPWALARESAAALPLMVAGGLGPGNVRAALEESSAWGVDVSSGVEASPGIKDARLMERLFAQVAGVRCTTAPGDGEYETQKGPRR
jgi:phosphoribosylanthranilate isomerase